MRRLLQILAVNTAVCVAAIAGASAGSQPRLQTGGFDYDEDLILTNAAEATWLATHHDMIVGAQRHNNTSFDRMKEATYDKLKAANSKVLLIGYVPFQTIQPWMSSWMEAWAKSNSLDPEDIYCHYDVDTAVHDRDNVTRTRKGYPHGTATSRSASRMKSTWWQGTLPNACPTSSTFRAAYAALAAEEVSINVTASKYLDGVMLDTFDGTIDTNFALRLENTVEMRALGKTSSAAAISQAAVDLRGAYEQARSAVATRIGRPARILANGADADNFYNWFADLYSKQYSTTYGAFCMEFYITSAATSQLRIPRLKQMYDDMTNPTRPIEYFINSQTNYTSGVTHAFNQFIFAAAYLINNGHGYFSYHKGSGSYYGAENGSFKNAHWHPNLDYNVGTPVKRPGLDYWGVAGTDRFFTFLDGGKTFTVLGREYTNALVLAKFGNVGGWSNIGAQRAAVPLGGSYQQLLADNSLGPVITSINLGFGEGAILVKTAPAGDGTNLPPGTPQNARRLDLH